MVRAAIILVLSSSIVCSMGCHKRAKSSGLGPAEQPPPEGHMVASKPAPVVDECQGQPEPILSQSRLLFYIPARALCLVRVPSADRSRAQLAELGLAESLADGGLAGWLQKMLGKISDDGGKDLVDPDLLAHFLSDAAGGHGECAVALIPDPKAGSRRLDVLAAWALESEAAAAPPLDALKAAALPQARTGRTLLVSTSQTLIDEASRRGEHGRGSLVSSGPFALAWQTAASQDDVVHAFVSLSRLWEYLPSELGDASRRLRLNSYESLLYSWRVDAGQCVETLHVGSRDRDHPLRTLIGPAALDGSVLLALPANARHVSTLGSGDEDLLSRARSLLDPERDHALDACLGLLSQMCKVDFQAELNACVGSELAYATVPVAAGEAPLIAATL